MLALVLVSVSVLVLVLGYNTNLEWLPGPAVHLELLAVPLQHVLQLLQVVVRGDVPEED